MSVFLLHYIIFFATTGGALLAYTQRAARSFGTLLCSSRRLLILIVDTQLLSRGRSGSSRMLTGGMDGKTSGGALGNGDEVGLFSAL